VPSHIHTQGKQTYTHTYNARARTQAYDACARMIEGEDGELEGEHERERQEELLGAGGARTECGVDSLEIFEMGEVDLEGVRGPRPHRDCHQFCDNLPQLPSPTSLTQTAPPRTVMRAHAPLVCTTWRGLDSVMMCL